MFLKYVNPGKSRLNSLNIFKIWKGNGTRLETRLGQTIFHFFLSVDELYRDFSFVRYTTEPFKSL